MKDRIVRAVVEAKRKGKEPKYLLLTHSSHFTLLKICIQHELYSDVEKIIRFYGLKIAIFDSIGNTELDNEYFELGY